MNTVDLIDKKFRKFIFIFYNFTSFFLNNWYSTKQLLSNQTKSIESGKVI